MRHPVRRLLTAVAAAALACSPLSMPVQAEEAKEPRFAVAAKLAAALESVDKADDPAAAVAVLQAAAAEARVAMPANVLVQDLLREAQQAESDDARALVKTWRAAVTEARDTLLFEPLLEAPLPEGFPQPAPIGEIRVQSYPAYRVARTDMTLLEGRAFWTLFNHIKRRDIAMTAPVEMGYTPAKDGRVDKSSMAFLCRSTNQGRLEVDGKVAVVDLPAQKFVSLGLRGDATKARVNDARRRLEGWLQTHGDEYEPAGPLRVLGYNSPFVADEKRLTEVQIPVRSK